jgi:hypothetical protein
MPVLLSHDMATLDELVYREEGAITASVASDITFYLSRFEGIEEALIAAYELTMAPMEPHITWYRTEKMNWYARITPNALLALPTWFRRIFSKRSEYGLELISGRTPREVGPFGFKFFIAPSRLKVEAGYFQFHLPAEWLRDEQERVVSLVQSIADVLPFRSGHAGYGIQYYENADLENRDARIRAWCSRYRGLDCRDLGMIQEYVVNSVKGVNWLTFLDQDFCKRLGGIECVRNILPAPISVVDLRSGCMIRAGLAPALGDRNRREDLVHYRGVNDLVKPLRMERGWWTPWFDADEALEWSARFDTQ